MAKELKVRTGFSRAERIFAVTSIAALLLVFVVFHLVSIGSAVIAEGRVVVQGKPRPVQSLEAGGVHAIHIKNGDKVEAGQVLVELDPTLTEINRNIIRGRLAELIARQSRLDAEQQGLDTVELPQATDGVDLAAIGRHLAGQRDIFRSRRAVLDSRKNQLRERIEQHGAEISGLEAQIEATESQIDFVSQEVGNLVVLSEKGLVPESRLLELQGRQAGLLGDVAQQRSELERVRNAIRDATLKMLQTDQEFHEEVATELRDVTAQVDENRLELARISETLSRLDVRAPVGGIVHELQVWTVGSVVSPQETLLTVVPVSDGVEFELRVQPDAIDTVRVGQPTRLRFPAFDQRSTPELNGAISGISPDAVEDPATGQVFYRVIVGLPETEIDRIGASKLIPGMPLEAFLQTGERSVLNFLVKPLVDQFSHAFRES